jgi:Flp pilus assembly protein CpaB
MDELLKTLLKKHKLLLLALILGLSAFLLSYNAFSLYIKTEKVVVSVRDLDPYHKISRADVRLVECPAAGVHERCLRTLDDAVGKYTVSRVFQGEMLLDAHIISGQHRPGISMEIQPEERCIFVPAEYERAVGGKINPGDLVDLIWARKNATRLEDLGSQGALTLITSARVIETVIDESSGEFRGVVIACLPITCEKLAQYIESGSIYLCLAPWAANERYSLTDAEVWPAR